MRAAVPAPLPRVGAPGRGVPRPVVATAVVVAAIGVWQGAITAFAIPAFVMPPPATVAQAFLAKPADIALAVLATCRSAALGLAVAAVLALLLAVAFTSSRALARAVLPLVVGLRTVPVLAVAPILIMTFGRGLGTGIAVVVIVAFFPIMVNAMRGFASTSRSALELMHVCGAGPVQTFLKVRLPMALPFVFTGLRTASAGAFLSAMLAEWLSGAPGLGTLILESSSYRDLGTLWAAVLVSMAVAFLVFAVTEAAERRFLTWRR